MLPSLKIPLLGPTQSQIPMWNPSILLPPILFLALASADNTVGKFWWFTDFHLDIWGHTSTTDMICAWTPSPQMESAIQAMKASNPNPDFILMSGDIVHFPGRNSSDLSRENILDTIAAVNGWLLQQFPNVSVYPAFGNHDHHPSNNYPVNDVENESSWLYGAVAEMWKTWLPESALETVRQGGWYAADVVDVENLRIITLNTNYLTVYNTELIWNTTIAEVQLEWLEKELAQAKADNVMVYMNGHHPMVGVHIEGGVEVGSVRERSERASEPFGKRAYSR